MAFLEAVEVSCCVIYDSHVVPFSINKYRGTAAELTGE